MQKCPLKEIQERSGKLLDKWVQKQLNNIEDKAATRQKTSHEK
jgi:hypothetical protein